MSRSVTYILKKFKTNILLAVTLLIICCQQGRCGMQIWTCRKQMKFSKLHDGWVVILSVSDETHHICLCASNQFSNLFGWAYV